MIVNVQVSESQPSAQISALSQGQVGLSKAPQDVDVLAVLDLLFPRSPTLSHPVPPSFRP